MNVFNHIWTMRAAWMWLVIVIIPIGLLNLEDSNPDDKIDMTQVGRCAYVIVIMAVLWVTESLPIPVTALLPIFLFPMVGVEIPKVMSGAYVTDTTMLFLGGLIVAVALEETGLHTRISLSVMMLVGAQPIMLMLGLMVTTWFLSMWISNTAATSMMIPIISSVVNTVREVRANSDRKSHVNPGFVPDNIPMDDTVKEKNSNKYIVNGTSENAEASPAGNDENADNNVSNIDAESLSHDSPEMRRLAKGLALSVAYGANIGGIATLTGTPPNLVLKENADDLYGGESPVSFAKWMGYAFPMSLLTLVLAWLYLSLIFLRCSCFKKMPEQEKSAIKETIRARFKKLGRITLAEAEVLCVFVLLVIFWLFRAPPNIDGWGKIFGVNKDDKSFASDSTPVILLAVFLFILPMEVPNVLCWYKEGQPSYTPILKWQVVVSKVPWGVIILLGGGFALAKAAGSSGLSLWVGEELAYLEVFDTWIMNLLMCIIVASFTEITSNTATAQLLLPILKNMSLTMNVHPLYLMISATISCSFAFMLPVATPPNAIVFSTGYLYIWEMALVGIPMNIIAILSLTLSINTWGDSMFDLGTVPEQFRTTLEPTMVTNATLLNTTTTMNPLNVTIP